MPRIEVVKTPWVAACCAMILSACESDPSAEPGDAAVVADAAIEDAAGPDYPWVWVVDRSEPLVAGGSPGAEICGVFAVCDGRRLLAVEAHLTEGEGEICDAIDPERGCHADRTDPQTVLDDGSLCDVTTVPSDYMVLGEDGSVVLRFEHSLRGCEVEVVQILGNHPDGFEVYVCDAGELGATCLGDGPVGVAPPGHGTLRVEVP